MIAFQHRNGKVVRRFEGRSTRVLGASGLLVVAHKRKLKGLSQANVVDVADVDIKTLRAPLYKLSVTTSPLALVYDADAVAPVRVDDLQAAVDAIVADAGTDRSLAGALVSALAAARGV